MRLQKFRLVTTALLFGFSETAFCHDVHFPAGFQWCVATAAHQIEGYNTESDWWDWEQIPGHIKNGETSGPACDHWNHLTQDVSLMTDLGVSTYRFSIEWAKVEPQEGEYNLAAVDHYREEIQLLRAAGITPFITLQHFTMPRWLRTQGGWEWSGTPAAFERFAKYVYREIAPGTQDWVTINEPMVHIMGGYYQGVAPPGEHRSFEGLIPVFRGMLAAHARAYRAIHRLADEAGAPVRVGMAHHLRAFDPYNWLSALDGIAAQTADQAWNWMIPDALETGRLELHVPFQIEHSELIPDLAGTEDFFGVNYYTGDLVSFSMTKGIELRSRNELKKSDLGWDIYSEGFYRVLMTVTKRYPWKSIFVTENGIADARDEQRPDFLRSHLLALSKAVNEGASIEGYCHWSLMDNFEWIEGFTPRFGLYEVDYDTFERTPRPGAKLFREIIRQNGF